jgi:hypothetical protein
MMFERHPENPVVAPGLYPLAALLLPLLRLNGGRGIHLYACAKLRSAPQ